MIIFHDTYNKTHDLSWTVSEQIALLPWMLLLKKALQPSQDHTP